MPTIEPFKLESFQRADISRTLGYDLLSPELADAIEHAIACFLATKDGNPDTTVANTIAALDEILAHGRTYEQAVQRIADDKSSVDCVTHDRLQALALAVMGGDVAARDGLDCAAREERGQLLRHRRITPKTEALHWFCVMLKLFFDEYAAKGLERTPANSRVFALEALTIAGVNEPDFGTHPERLTEYMETDVTCPSEAP